MKLRSIMLFILVQLLILYWFHFPWTYNLIYIVAATFMLNDIVESIAIFSFNATQIHNQYLMKLEMLIRYRFTHNVVESMRAAKSFHGELPLHEFSRGDYDFEKLRNINKHYLWQTLIAHISTASVYGDEAINDKLYDLESEIDYWYDALKMYQRQLGGIVKKLILLSGMSIFVAYFVSEMLIQAVSIDTTSTAKLMLFGFVLSVNGFVCAVVRILRQDMVIRRENVL